MELCAELQDSFFFFLHLQKRDCCLSTDVHKLVDFWANSPSVCVRHLQPFILLFTHQIQRLNVRLAAGLSLSVPRNRVMGVTVTHKRSSLLPHELSDYSGQLHIWTQGAIE